MISGKKFIKSLSSVVLAAMMTAILALAPSNAAVAAGGINELTGLPTAAPELQRPIAVMIDNDAMASPHYGLAEADIIYEMVNSTKNRRVTRLMAIYKDYNNVARLGNIRSARPTNIILANEYDAILIHDGGPIYINPFISMYMLPHLSGGFSRIPNGKPSWYTEYCLSGEAARRIAGAGYSFNYVNPACAQNRFNFGYNDLAAGMPVNCVALPFPHNSTMLMYNAATGNYDWNELGSPVVDAEDFQQVTFKNVIIQCAPMVELDGNGYMIYGVVGSGVGYYLTNGRCIAITWYKDVLGHTVYFNPDGTPITVNPGKTYIGIVPTDSWDQVIFA
ncbi:MAG: DUF3048 domain-containing protein [Lachnospiraceae bacterium]|nr:DUF3048 domain-containing protein [Lachnospiraceae bacterium]